MQRPSWFFSRLIPNKNIKLKNHNQKINQNQQKEENLKNQPKIQRKKKMEKKFKSFQQ